VGPWEREALGGRAAPKDASTALVTAATLPIHLYSAPRFPTAITSYTPFTPSWWRFPSGGTALLLPGKGRGEGQKLFSHWDPQSRGSCQVHSRERLAQCLTHTQLGQHRLDTNPDHRDPRDHDTAFMGYHTVSLGGQLWDPERVYLASLVSKIGHTAAVICTCLQKLLPEKGKRSRYFFSKKWLQENKFSFSLYLSFKTLLIQFFLTKCVFLWTFTKIFVV
jgi:hypothetical protein